MALWSLGPVYLIETVANSGEEPGPTWNVDPQPVWTRGWWEQTWCHIGWLEGQAYKGSIPPTPLPEAWAETRVAWHWARF